MKRLAIAVLISATMYSPASADDGPRWFGIATEDPFSGKEPPKLNSFSVFGGAYTTESLGGTWPWASPDYTDDYFLGAAYTRDFLDLPWGFMLGGEAGGALRFGEDDDTSGEIWGGLRLRHHGLVIGGLNIAPAITVGVSAVSDTLPIEEAREQDRDGSATFLGYVGPELSFRLRSLPNFELVYRLHHRSGANGVFGNMHEGSNANALGIRIRF